LEFRALLYLQADLGMMVEIYLAPEVEQRVGHPELAVEQQEERHRQERL
jgi:hypothetical protein